MGSGVAAGENRAVEAATQAISSPLLENICIDGATGIIINVTGGSDLTLWEVNEASTLITEAAHPDAEIIFGAVIDETMGDRVSVTVIATGFGTQPAKTVDEQISKLHAMTEAQIINAGVNQLLQKSEANLAPQAFESIQLRVDAVQTLSPLPLENLAPQPSKVEEPQFGLTGHARSEKVLPRDILLAKARAYRDSQPAVQPEQLSMNMEEEAARSAEPQPRAPFETDNLEIPAYLRRKRGPDNESDSFE